MKASDLQKYYFNKPVAVQLAGPCMMIDNDGEKPNQVEHEGHLYGYPQGVIEKGQAAAQMLLVGVLSFVPGSEELLQIRTKGERNAVVLITLRPQQVQHVFLVERPGDGLPMISVPGKN